MKALGIAIVCGIIGGFIGLLVGMGETRYTKKSQRETVFPIFAIAGTALGFIGGIMVGFKMDEEDKAAKEKQRILAEQLEQQRIKHEENLALEKKLGLNNIASVEVKDGRKWCFQSSWTNPETGNLNVVETRYNKEQDTVVTSFNNNLIYDHKTNSGSKVNIDSFHHKSLNDIKDQIKENLLTLI